MKTSSILEKINQAGLKFLLPLTPEETYKTIVHEAVKLIDAEYASIILFVDEELKRVYSSSEKAFKTTNRTNGNTKKAFTTRQVIVADIKETGKFHPELKTFGIRSTIFIPLAYQDKSIGVLTVNAKKKIDDSARDLQALKLVGSMATLAIRKAQTYDEAKRALEVRDMFISLASHELRTPLTSINGYIQLLNSRMGKQNTSEAEWVRELYNESKRLTNLIQELLEINRIKQGQLQFVLRESNFSKIVQQAIERCKQLYSDRKITLMSLLTDDQDVVIGDFDKLLQVVLALLENALKFSPADTKVEVKLSRKNQNILLQICDQGSGISREDMAKIFDGFYKAQEHHKEGMGVGLLLAKHIINYHKGSITVHSEVKKGTIVTVLLPAANS